MTIELMMPSNHLSLYRPFLLPLIFLTIRVFSNESALCIMWSKYWSFSFSIIFVLPVNIQGWFPLGSTGLVSLLSKGLSRVFFSPTIWRHHFSSTTGFQHSAFFMAHLSYLYTTAGKTVDLTIWTFVSKVMSLLSNTLSSLVIAFLLSIKHLLILWLQSPSTVILEPPNIKSATVPTFYPSIFYEVMGPDATILVFWMLTFKPTSLLFHLHQEAL